MDKFIASFINFNNEKYDFETKLGEGIYLIKNIKSGKMFVLKTLVKRDEYPGNFDMFQKRFHDIQSIQNVNLLFPEDIGLFNKQFYKITPFHEMSLQSVIEHRNLTVKEAILIFEDLLRNINSFHINKQIHGNLKSTNIFLDKNGKVLLCDFMFEKKFKDSIYKIPQTDDILIYHRDIYSLGIIFYELLNWEIAKELPRKQIHIPGNFYSVVEKCCYDYKECGFNSANDVLKYLKKANSDLTQKVKTEEVQVEKIEIDKNQHLIERKKKKIILYAVMYVLIGIIALYLYLKNF